LKLLNFGEKFVTQNVKIFKLPSITTKSCGNLKSQIIAMPFDMPLVSFESKQVAWPIMKLACFRTGARERERERKSIKLLLKHYDFKGKNCQP
jgi:hypothetical protein